MTRVLSLPLFAALALFLTGCPDTEPVEAVDVERYLGLWYEVASYPAPFQEGCVATTAEYGATDDPAVISVVNRCRLDAFDGPEDVIEGTARITDDSGAKLSVSFGEGFAGAFGFGAPYWIIELDDAPGPDPYRWAVVSEPTANFLWILSRTPTMDPAIYAELRRRLDARRFDLDRLRETPQPAGL